MSNIVNHILDPQYVGVYIYIAGVPITVLIGIAIRRLIDRTMEKDALKRNQNHDRD